MQQNEYQSLAQAAKQVPGNPHPSAVWRWCRNGVLARSGTRIKLEHVRIGGRIYTTRAWLTSFFKAVATADASHFDRSVGTSNAVRNDAIPNPTQQSRVTQIKNATEQLVGAGW